MKLRLWGGFLLAATLALVAPVLAHAASFETHSTRLRFNEDSPHGITITRTITGVKNFVNASFDYELMEDPSNPEIVGALPFLTTLHVSGHVENDTNSISGTEYLDLGEAEFSKVGDYKFILREIHSSDEVNYPVDESHEYYIYAYVRNQIVDNAPTGELIATLVLQAKNHDEGEKTDVVFSNHAERTRIEVSKTLTGSAADTNEYFKFIVKIRDQNGDRYTISGQDDNIEYRGEHILNSEYLEANEEGQAIYLRHGQTITIGFSEDLNEIPIGVAYTIEEVGAADYVTTVDGVEGKESATKTTAIISGGILPDSNKTAFVNNRESEVLTGVTAAIIPAIAILVAAVVGTLIVKRATRKNTKKR